jgi:hypothetical protein
LGTQRESLSYTPYPGLEEVAAKVERNVEAVLTDLDVAARAKDEAKLLTAIGGC